MFQSQFKWQLLNNNKINNENELINCLLENRNVENKIKYFSDDLSLYDSFLFNDMDKVVKRIKEAIHHNEKIMIYGDFDVDGVTGVALLYKTLRKFTENCFYYIPNRFTEGYGPNQKAFEGFVEHGFSVIITIDNGISGIEEAKYLKAANCDLIITDHHEPKAEIPLAYAILHPKLPGERYPFKDLSGSGVAFKLAHALCGEVPTHLIDLAGLGTFSDMVSLQDENRVIVKWGLKQLNITAHLGLRLLTQAIGVNKIDEYALGFIYGPRINAPGRMDNGNVAVRLLVTEDYEEASGLVNDIEALNNSRKAKIETIVAEAIEVINDEGLDKYNVILVTKPDWHEGVLGIICNRLLAIYHKPVIVLTESEDEKIYKGSGRSLDDFPLTENLEKCQDLLERFGGHKMAAGIMIKRENIDKLRNRLHTLAYMDLNNYLKVDCIIDEKLINLQLTDYYQKFRPFGMNNENPLFLIEDCEVITCSTVGSDAKHLKLTLKKNELNIEGIWFNFGGLSQHINIHDKIDVIGNFAINEYNGYTTNQLKIEDMRCNHKQIFDCRNKPLSSISQKAELMYLYFEKDFNIEAAAPFSHDLEFQNDIVLIDIPEKYTDLVFLLNHKNIKNYYFLFKYDDLINPEHLLTRDKLGRFYLAIQKLNQFNPNDPSIIGLFEKMGFNKKIQKISIDVFFELNFVIIEDNNIKLVENPEKRQLTESKTFQSISEQAKLREMLILSSQEEFKNFIKNIITEE